MLKFTSPSDAQDAMVEELVTELTRTGLVALPQILTQDQLADMRRAFEARLKRLRWNNIDGYEKTEPYRHMVEDVLTLDQGFLDAALHPLVKAVLTSYLGDRFELTEAKGWKSIPTKRDFHGWHGDAWYDQKHHAEIPPEVKLAIYLTDVRSGAFNYIRGSHRKQHPRMVRGSELRDVPASQIVELLGPAGTAFLFDTSGIHRQGVPMLEPRRAVFYNYHDPHVRLQKEDIDLYRYHPLVLNAAFLGNLTQDDQGVLGFGNKTNFLPAFEEPTNPSLLHGVFSTAHDMNLIVKKLNERVVARIKRTFKPSP
ncbi:MAG TPA: phytanoyl-CoA dioxygenase family protein [Pyrinomonadaceae bacterium]|nr:phytanoyl-CoA dioxygenase family protein [Pyrinomonadaceae bacterium]